MKHLFALALGVALAIPAESAAAELGWNAFELGFMRHADGSTGPVASLSAEIGDAGWYIGLGHGRAYTDGHGARFARASLGFAYGVAPLTDLIAEAGLQRATDAWGSADSRYALLGVSRAMGSERVIASLRENHYFGGDLDASETTAAVAIDLYFTSRWSVLAQVELADAGEATLLALHYNY